MWRASALALALTALPALVGEEPRAQSRGRADAPAPAEAAPASHDALARQVADELAAIDRALSAVGAKLGEADAARARRIAAAYRLLRAPLGSDPGAMSEANQGGGDPAGFARGAGRSSVGSMSAARRRAAVRLLLERDLAERRLLAGEDAQLRRAAAEKQAAAARVPELELPVEIGRPARGKIVRRFGATRHERSKATLSRRGIELEVDARSAAVAPADGVVRYAGPIRGLDAGVILDHGGYLTVIGKLGAVSVPLGARVSRGDRIGRAAHHRVYLEVRVKLGAGGLPIDPEPLLPRRGHAEGKPR